MEKHSPLLAFSYMFKDNKFWTKFGVLFILTFLCLLQCLTPENKESLSYLLINGFFALIAFITNIVYYGYLAAGVKSITEQKENYILPFFNFKTHGIIGLKFFVASLLFSIVIGLLILAVCIIGGIIYAIVPPLGLLIGITLLIAFTLVCLIYGMAFFRMFAMTQDIFALFRIKEIFQSVHNDFWNYIKHLLTMFLLIIPLIVAVIIYCILFTIPAIISPNMAMLTLCIIMSGIGAYSNMCFMYICAKCIK